MMTHELDDMPREIRYMRCHEIGQSKMTHSLVEMGRTGNL